MNSPDQINTAGTAAEVPAKSMDSRRGRRQDTPSLKRALIVLGCGLALTAAGAVPLAGEVSAAIADNPSVKGTIVDIRIEEPADAKAPAEGEKTPPPSCSPVVGYEVDGQGYNASSNDFSTDCNWTVGQEVKVAYNPENPVEARITTEEFNAVTTILPGAGALVFIGGLLMTISGLRKRKHS